jgi:hypothetical protein
LSFDLDLIEREGFFSFNGMLRIVFKFSVISSPVVPSPQVAPTVKTAFS